MKNNAEVREAFEEAQKTFEMLATAQAVTPPNDLKSKIWDKIQQQEKVESDIEKPVIPIQTSVQQSEITTTAQDIKTEKNSSWKNFAIAASLLFLVSIGANLYWMNSQAEINEKMVKLESEAQSKNVAMQNMQPVSYTHLTLPTNREV